MSPRRMINANTANNMANAANAANAALPNISDTARWVAFYRAVESKRPDALFRDHLAARLAGDRGRLIAEAMPSAMRKSFWPIVVRTRLIDDLVYVSISEGVDRVINLAAGLDARPYRLDLPGSLTWVEADLPAIMAEKDEALAAEKPVCKLVRAKVDLTDAAARVAFLDGALEGANRALVITEGLVVYLESDAVRGLARDLASRPSIHSWIVDLVSPGVLRMMQKKTGSRLGESAQMKFGPPEGVTFFAPLGWAPAEIRSMFHEASRTKRLPPLLRILSMLPLPDPNPRKLGRAPWSGVVRFVRAR